MSGRDFNAAKVSDPAGLCWRDMNRQVMGKMQAHSGLQEKKKPHKKLAHHDGG